MPTRCPYPESETPSPKRHILFLEKTHCNITRHLQLCLPSGLIHSGLPIEIRARFSYLHAHRMFCPSYHLAISTSELHLVGRTYSEAPQHANFSGLLLDSS
jgi:hypothetical protein